MINIHAAERSSASYVTDAISVNQNEKKQLDYYYYH